MRPSSSASDADGTPETVGLIAGLIAHGATTREVSDEAWLRAMLDAEGALARGAASCGVVPPDAAAIISDVCRDRHGWDLEWLSREALRTGTPVIGLVRAIEERVRLIDPDASSWVHHGATSQDIADTAAMLVVSRAIVSLVADLHGAADLAADLAQAHRDTLMVGRTLLQQAVPTTFGLVAATWATALDGVSTRLLAVRSALPAQYGGAAGTLAATADDALAVREAYATELGLVAPVLSWHTIRTPVAEVAGVLATCAGVAAKVALDIVLLAQTEVGEVTEVAAGRGGSSTMPHKRNPVAAVSARAAALAAPGLAGTLYAAMAQEHQRAAGAWHVEAPTLSELIRVAGSAACWLRDSLQHLEIHPDRMRANLELAPVGAEAVSAALVGRLGRSEAHELVAAAVRAAPSARTDDLIEALASLPQVAAVLERGELERLLDPAHHVGRATELVDRALSARRSSAS